jgi:histone demethylase JARID1
MTTEEVPTQLFYLRKIEGAEVLLTYETNYFRQVIHKWSPIAPEAPPILEQSLSTRKPRPTKQQKMMAQLGVDKPEDLPAHLRTKPHNFSKRKSTEAHTGRPPPLQPAPQFRSDTPFGHPRSGSTGNPPTGGSTASVSGSQPPQAFGYNQPFSLSASEGSPPYGAASSTFLPTVNGIHSPTFSAHSPASHHPDLEPSLFSPPPNFSRSQPLPHQGTQADKDGIGSVEVDVDSHNPFGSSPRANMDDVFADLTNQDAEQMEGLENSHANEALEALRSASDSGDRSGSGSTSLEDLNGHNNGDTDTPDRAGAEEPASQTLADEFLS